MRVSNPPLRRWLAGCALTLSLSGCFTVGGVVVGGMYASSRNGDPLVQSGQKDPTSVGTCRLVGGVVGALIDIGFVAIIVSQPSNHFGH